MVKIRLMRCGAKKRPCYRFVVSDVRAPRDGRFIDSLGSYAPTLPDSSPHRLVIDLEKLAKWQQIGAQLTDRVKKLVELVKKGATSKSVKSSEGQSQTGS